MNVGLVWALTQSLVSAPAPAEEVLAPTQEDPAPGADADSSAAWEAAGWGAPATGEAEDEEDEEDEGAASEPARDPSATEANDAWAAAGWGAPAPTEGESEPATEPTLEASKSGERAEGKDGPRFGDIVGGSLRLTGTYLHFDDSPELFPDGDDGLGVALGRLLVRGDVGEHLRFDFNGFLELSRSPASLGGSGLGGAFTSAGATQSAYRTQYLGWQFWGSGSISGQLGVDYMAMKVKAGPVQIDVGRFPVTYAVTTMFTTNDFFAPFSATAVNTIYKPGVDALRLSAGIGARASWDLVGVLGYEAEFGQVVQGNAVVTLDNEDAHLPSWGRSALLTRASVVAAGYEWAVLGGKVSERWVGGGSLQGDAGPLTLRAEFHVGIPDEDGDGHDRDDEPVYGRAAGGFGVTFAWQNASLFAEYMYASDGSRDVDGYVDRALAGYSDDLPYLGQHYVGVAGGLEILPILRLGTSVFVSGTDGSGLAGVSIIYNVADESDFILGVYVPWGKGFGGVDPMSGRPDLGSEFGLSPLSVYLEARVFF